MPQWVRPKPRRRSPSAPAAAPTRRISAAVVVLHMRLHMVNGTQELVRAHASMRRPHQSPAGQDLKATAGLVASIVSLLDDPREDVTHIAVAFDWPAPSFRNELFAEYRVTPGITEAVAAQMAPAAQAVAALGVTVWPMRRFEANDALASAARRWRGEVEQVRLFSMDPLLAQCVHGDRVVMVNHILRRVTTAQDILKRYGCRPAALPDWVALVGDAGHGIPGVPRFGTRSAAALMRRFGCLEAIPEDDSTWTVARRHTARLSESLRQSRQAASLYKRLATLRTDAPNDSPLTKLRWRGADEQRLATIDRTLGIAPTLPRAWRRI